MKLYIDDVRIAPKDYYLQAWTSQEAFIFVESFNKRIEFISFDHDLGLLSQADGYDLVKALTKLDEEIDWITPTFDFTCHSANPVGRENINCWLNGYLRYKRSGNIR